MARSSDPQKTKNHTRRLEHILGHTHTGRRGVTFSSRMNTVHIKNETLAGHVFRQLKETDSRWSLSGNRLQCRWGEVFDILDDSEHRLRVALLGAPLHLVLWMTRTTPNPTETGFGARVKDMFENGVLEQTEHEVVLHVNGLTLRCTREHKVCILKKMHSCCADF